VSVGALARTNQISDPDLLIAGERLRLPQGHRCAAARSNTPPAAHARADRLLSTASAQLDAADFEASIASAEACVQALKSSVHDSKANAISARCHFVAGMAAAGLDQRERAIGEFRRAFELNPKLQVEPEGSSPRVVELLSAARPSSGP